MSIVELVTLLGIMVALAAMPSTSVMLVITRSMTAGLANGIAVALGIVAGDLVFILLALLGLSVVAETMGGLFSVVKYLGAIYLLWLGFSLLTAPGTSKIAVTHPKARSNLAASLLAGFFLTLGDVKAIFFYASLFPMFANVSAFQAIDVLIVMAVTLVAVGGVKIIYALSATQIAVLLRGFRFEKAARKTAGGLLVGAGGYLMLKT